MSNCSPLPFNSSSHSSHEQPHNIDSHDEIKSPFRETWISAAVKWLVTLRESFSIPLLSLLFSVPRLFTLSSQRVPRHPYVAWSVGTLPFLAPFYLLSGVIPATECAANFPPRLAEAVHGGIWCVNRAFIVARSLYLTPSVYQATLRFVSAFKPEPGVLGFIRGSSTCLTRHLLTVH